MSRYARDLVLHVPADRELRDVGTVGSIDALRARVHNGRVTAYVPIASSVSSPPVFTGHVVTDEGGVIVRGRIRESFTNAAPAQGSSFVIVILPVCVTLRSVQRRQRQAEWTTQADTLAATLQHYVRSG